MITTLRHCQIDLSDSLNGNREFIVHVFTGVPQDANLVQVSETAILSGKYECGSERANKRRILEC